MNHPTPEQPTTCLVMFAIVALGFCATVLHAVTETTLQRVIVVLVGGSVLVAILGRIKRLHREDEERFNAQMNGKGRQ